MPDYIEDSCEWFGSATDCGKTSRELGDFDDDGLELVEWTKEQSASDLRFLNRISTSCYNDYGNGCWSGYKRLWCDPGDDE